LSYRRARDGTRSSSRTTELSCAFVRFGGRCRRRVRNRSRRVDVDTRSASANSDHRRSPTVCGHAFGASAADRTRLRFTATVGSIDPGAAYRLGARNLRHRVAQRWGPPACHRVGSRHAPGFYDATRKPYRSALGTTGPVSACDSTNWGRLATFPGPHSIASRRRPYPFSSSERVR
jgi:hypothetical protein